MEEDKAKEMELKERGIDKCRRGFKCLEEAATERPSLSLYIHI